MPKYHIFESWIATGKEIHTVKPPDTLRLTRENTFTYAAPRTIAVGGIYSQAEVEAMANQLMFPVERQAVENTIIKVAMGQHPQMDNVKVDQLITDEHIESLKSRIMSTVWEGFIKLGTISAEILGIITILKFLTWILEIAFNSKIKYDLYGAGFKNACGIIQQRDGLHDA
ncbi:unnamed protein product [Angiostrongylus costaricensis]|uniref:PHB domain-containing protein n=1 Tax=Angiostrongylus costaricensis TaxID=334426 RepID=A0A0R3PHZ2_ANGCS|nr:unnamed protein product [Angiostrongylus costaricensis]